VGATPVEADDIKNGNVTISSTTDSPVTPVPGAPGCANTNWTEDINDVLFTSATIRLFQDQTPRRRGVRPLGDPRADRELHVQPANLQRRRAELGLHLHLLTA
jgi:hypothetical protein